eukprot:CAMPEP_0119018612 /NCGR_PEP_ID=MMETSP1176-20130426/19865_1 /TAXON_ID=265551 /ORGANISM="Synedropsis recta cf, Strain CCMP1620" /LENGTH=32 /DNA_ID= /DNA_START= /DNA_END= /DNA_ORIENTATION=
MTADRQIPDMINDELCSIASASVMSVPAAAPM